MDKDMETQTSSKMWKWFRWHRWPEEPKDTIQSVYEIVFLLIVFLICLFLYYEMNQVRIVKHGVKVVCLDRKAFVPDSTGQVVEKLISPHADIGLLVPMTKMEMTSYPSDETLTKVINKSLEQGGVGLPFQHITWDTCRYWEKRLYDYTFKRSDENSDSLRYFYDSIMPEDLPDSLRYPVFYISDEYYNRGNYFYNPFRKLIGNEIVSREPEIKVDSVEKYHILFSSKDSTKNISFVSGCRIPNIIFAHHTKQSIWFLPFVKFNFLLGNPGWLSLEDISQQYYDLKLDAYSIDSLTLMLEFVGASEFSRMYPEPDSVGMSGFRFTDQNKINQISKTGLKFHVKFKELENMQQIRMFFLTSIMAGIFTIFIVFVILAIYKMTSRNKKKILHLVPKIGLGLFIYLVIFEFFHLKVLSNLNYIVCDILSCIISLFIVLILISRRARMIAVSSIRIGFKRILIILIVTLLSSLAIKYITDYYNIEKMLNSGNYKRAANLAYDRLIKKDSITSDDKTWLEKVLLHTVNGGFTVNNVKECHSNDKQKVFIAIQEDSLWLFDLVNSRRQRFQLTQDSLIGRIPIVGEEFFTVNSINNTYLYDRQNINKMYPLKGRIINFADNERYVITRMDSTYYIYELNKKPKLFDKINCSADSRCIVPETGNYIAIHKRVRDNYEQVLMYDFTKPKKKQWKEIEGSVGFFKDDLLVTSTYKKRLRTFLYNVKDLTMKDSLIGYNPRELKNGYYQLVTYRNGIGYFHRFTSAGIHTDSINRAIDGTQLKGTGPSREMLEIANSVTKDKWCSIELLYKNEMIVRHYDKNNKNCILTYDVKHGEVPILNIEIEDNVFSPFKVEDDMGNTIFSISDDSLSFFTINKELIKVKEVFSLKKVRQWVVSWDYDKHRYELFSLENPQNHYYIDNSSWDYSADKIVDIIDNTAFVLENNKNMDIQRLVVSYVGNLESLINQCDYLEDDQKEKLIDKIKNM